MIDKFFDEYRFLSNFWPVQVWYEGVFYPSVEHAYVAAKTTDPEIRLQIRKIKSPGDVKRLGRTLALREDWDTIKLSVMRELLERKFARGSTMATQLINTYPQDLVEGNTWGDTFWGACKGKGHNHLGKLLMDIRFNLIMENVADEEFFYITAGVAHMANRAYCRSIGDDSQPMWDDAPEWQQTSAINGVKFHYANRNANASASHENWLAEKLADGWQWGEFKNPDEKLHPCILPYEQLPLSQQIKDHIFRSVAHAFFDMLEARQG